MSSLTRADLWLLTLVVPFWAFCTVLHADRQSSERPIAWFPIYVESAADANSYPVAVRPWPDAEIDAASVRAGDELVALGALDLRGRSRLFVMTHAYDAQQDRRVPVRVRREGRETAASVRLVIVPYAWSHLVVSVFMGLFATLALLRARGGRAARAYSAAALAFSLHFCSLYGGSPKLHLFSLVLIIVTGALYPPLMLRAALLFPPSQAPQSERVLWIPWVMLVTGPALYVWLFGAPSLGLFGFGYASACYSVAIGTLLLLLIRNYRRADARGRRQMHWGLYGFFIATMPPLVASLLVARDPALRFLYEASLVTQIALPAFIFVAFWRDNLFDINRLITTTVALVLLSPIAIGLIFEVGPLAIGWVSDATQLRPSTSRWTLLFLAALIIVPPVRYLRTPIENWLFREEYRFERALRAIHLEGDDEAGVGGLLRELGDRLAAIEVFETSAVFCLAGDAYGCVAAEGPLVPPAFEAEGKLPAILESATGPVLARGWRRLAQRGALLPHETAQLQSLGAEVLLPIRCDDELVGFAALGAKMSGDVYTRTELALLAALAERIGLELERRDDDSHIAQERLLHQELARYAPGSIVEELTRGSERMTGEREVTVLFVDIRGYSKLTRAREAPEIFELVNQYTLHVSRRIRDHGGSVVEFHGDGLMAAFGAPMALDEKERRAVAAARAIAKDVGSGAIDAAARARIRVGIGIATGPAFVGDIQSVDRKIWAVIGETTNLAARLEGLTRDLDATIAIDTTTHGRLGEASEGFVLTDGLHVKGWEEPISVWNIASATADKAAAA